MATETIASGATVTLSAALTGGTDIEFLNTPQPGGALVVDSSALARTGGGTGVTLGGAILGFAAGDQIDLVNLNADFALLDGPTEGASFNSELRFAAESGVAYFIEDDGTVKPSVNAPLANFDGFATSIVDELVAGILGPAAATETVTLTPFLAPGAPRGMTDAMLTVSAAVNPCFVAGTRILTARGEIRVETLRPGDRVITFGGEEREIVWIGRRVVDVARHPWPDAVRPVILEPDALGDGVPARRLAVSPDHAFYLDDLLVPAKHLINGANIRADTAAHRVTYYHVELPGHDILFAEGAAAESFLDTGHRGVFENAADPLLLHPDLMQIRREQEGCAPLCTGGPALAAIRAHLAHRRLTGRRAG